MIILLVRIQNYENESVENEIKTYLEQKGGEVLIEKYDLQDLEKIPLALRELSNSVDYMIGIYLAGFFVLAETNSNAKIVINPCMSPSSLPGLTADCQTLLRQLEEKTYFCADAEMRVVTYGIFTKESDEQDKEVFMKIYGRNMNGVDNYSLMEEEKFCLKLEKALNYHKYVASLGYWDHMPELINQ